MWTAAFLCEPWKTWVSSQWLEAECLDVLVRVKQAWSWFESFPLCLMRETGYGLHGPSVIPDDFKNP